MPMKKVVDYSLEDFISKSELLLEDVGDVEGLVGEIPSDTTEKINSQIRKKSIESIEKFVDLQINGYAEVSISEDEMKATADFCPPTGEMKPIELDDITELLDSKGIISGVDFDSIKEAIFKCNTERIQVTDVVIARGVKAVDEVPEHLIIEDRLLKESSSSGYGSGRVDFKEISPFVLVKEGQVLARNTPYRQGQMGSTIRGKAFAYKTMKITEIEAGENTRAEGDCIVTGCDGRFEYTEHSFRVNEVLEISSDVDYKTGHINFPGDVIIKGEIKDGFRVHSGGTVYCAKTMDASEVISQKDLIVKHGIIGRNKGRVKVAGKVETKFIENCYLEAKSDIFVENGILNSAIHTLKRLELGGKGIIIGGKIYAQDGVTAAQIGSALGPRTEIYCGIDYSVEQKLEWIRDKNIELALKLKQVERKLKAASEGKEKLIEVQEKLKQAIHRMNEAANSLIFQLDKNEEADVIVNGSIFSGAYIEICHFSYIVSREMKRVRFRLDKKKGRVVAESQGSLEKAVYRN